MKKIILSVLLFHIVSYAYEFEISDKNLGCDISMKLSLIPVEEGDRSGRAVVNLRLIDKAGAPISGKKIDLSASWGTFMCRLPEDTTNEESSDARSCFVTGDDGNARVNLVNIPFNSPVNVKAVCDCGGYTVSATGNLSIKQVRVKNQD
ncbi:MAG: hypothetical protein GXY77_13675 [Fibrobacter sp.]|nr:hypothetical protein [Fibrobacter sp.]